MNNKQIKNIVIIRTDRVGDVVLSTPVIESVRKEFSESRISFICRPYTCELLNDNPYLDEIIVYDKYGKHKSLISTVKLALSLRKKKFDLALILHPTNRAHLIAFLAGIKIRAGWDKKLSFLLTKKVPFNKHQGAMHEVEYNYQILKAVGINQPVADPLVNITQKDEDSFDYILKKNNIFFSKGIIVLGYSASCPSKRWPVEKFSQLINILNKDNLYHLVLISSQDEIDYGQSIVDKNETVIDLRGKLSLKDLAVLFFRSNLFISNDTGPVHIAAALRCPVISIFGRSDPGLSPKRWKPVGKNSYYIHKKTDCGQCLAHNCKNNFLCLDKISVDEVFNLAQKVLEA